MSTARPTTLETRADLEAAVDALVLSALPYASPTTALLNPPGRDNLRSSRWCDGLEGYARVGMLVGARVAGADGGDPHGFLERWASGIAAGTDPGHPERWPTPAEQGQAKVEAAAVVLLLEQTRPWLWDRLDTGVQERVVAWLSGVVGSWYPDNNWVWFRLVAEAFLTSVTGSVAGSLAGLDDDARHDLALHESFVREGGWYSDGAGRDFDHYGGWALHLYPLLWTRQPGARTLAAVAGVDVDVLRQRYAGRLYTWLSDAALLVGAGSPDDAAGRGAVPLLQGRSLIYRFAAAAPFWVGALEGCTPLSPGVTRRVGLGMARHFLRPVGPGPDGGALRPDGTLPLGWHDEFLPLVQPYSGPASPYWAAKGALGLLLPADHPVWTAPEEPLPVEAGDTAAALGAPGWLVSGTTADGVVRVLNHGTDHASPGATTPDDPLYARLAYSTATSPDLGLAAAGAPLDSAVVVLDPAGRASHRTGFCSLEVRRDDGCGAGAAVLVGVSQGRVHWNDDVTEGSHSNRAPADGDPGPWLTVASVVRGPLEVRLARCEASATVTDLTLRTGGWAVAEGQTLTSAVVGLRGLPDHGATTREGASPLARASTTPWAAGSVVDGGVTAALVVLTGDPAVDPQAAARATSVAVAEEPDLSHHVTVTWPDGVQTSVLLPRP